MKKQIAFYIGWDVVFTIFLYVYSSINIWMRNYTERTADVYPALWVQISLLVLAGGVISGLVLVSSEFQHTRKLAILEFIIIGIPAFYLATIIAMPYLVLSIMGYESMQYYTPLWLSRSSIPMIVGSIILGYELFVFIIRMFKCKKIKNTSETE